MSVVNKMVFRVFDKLAVLAFVLLVSAMLVPYVHASIMPLRAYGIAVKPMVYVGYAPIKSESTSPATTSSVETYTKTYSGYWDVNKYDYGPYGWWKEGDYVIDHLVISVTTTSKSGSEDLGVVIGSTVDDDYEYRFTSNPSTTYTFTFYPGSNYSSTSGSFVPSHVYEVHVNSNTVDRVASWTITAYYIPQKPIIHDLSVNPSDGYAPLTTNVYCNIHTTDAKVEYAKLYVDGRVVKSFRQIKQNHPVRQIYVELSKEVTVNSPGTHTYKCWAKSHNGETADETNTFTVYGAPDFFVGDSDFVIPSDVMEGDNVTVGLTIHNIGDPGTSNNLLYPSVVLYDNGTEIWRTTAYVPVGSQSTVSASIGQLSAGAHVLTFSVDPERATHDKDYSTNNVTKTLIVESNSVPNITLFDVHPTSGIAPLTVSFIFSAFDANDNTLSYTLDYGDGTQASGTVAPGENVTLNHTYYSNGTFVPTLVVTDSFGATDQASETVVVNAAFAPVVDFTWTPSDIIANQTLVVFNATQIEGSYPIVSWNWTFGDGTQASGQSVSHTFGNAGNYSVILFATDSNGQTTNAIHTITVNPEPVYLPDLVISSVTFDTPVEETIATNVKINVTNMGNANASNVSLSYGYTIASTSNIRLNSKGGIVPNDIIASGLEIPAGTSVLVNIAWTPTTYGSYAMSFVVDPENIVPELNESNNGYDTSVYVNPLPDFTVGSISVDGTSTAGHSLTINTEIKNIGHTSGTVHYVVTSTNTNNASDVSVNQGDVLVNENGEETVTNTWTPTVNGTYTISVSLDPNNDVDELNESNNYKEISVTIGSNQPPVVEPIPDQVAYVGEEFDLQVNASDPDGDTLQYSDNSSLFDIDQNGHITFTPGDADVGNYTIEIIVSDGMTSTSTTFNLEVNPPVLAIENVTVSTTNQSAFVSWDTTVPATTKIEWGTTQNYGNVFEDGNYTTHHQANITSLLPDNTYYYRITAVDSYNQETTYENSFHTLANPTGMPDMTISNIYYPTQIFNDEQADVIVEVQNLGDTSTGQFWVTLNGGDTQYQSIDNLAPGESRNVTFVWTPEGAGEFNLTASVDPMNAVNESDETNNQEVITIDVIERTWDVAVSGLSAPGNVIEGDSFTVTANISNLGNQNLTTNVTLYVNGTEIETRAVSLVPGDSTLLDFNLIFNDAGDYDISVVADPSNALNESDETNNQMGVIVTVAPNQPPIAEAGPDVNTFVGELVVFNASQSYDPDGTITSYAWDFGDGTTGTGQAVNHTYTNAGVYTVTLTVTDDKGAIGQDTLTTVVSAPVEKPDFAITNVDYPAKVNPGDNATIMITVYNLGNESSNTSVSVYSNSGKIGDYPISLGVGEGTSVTFGLSNLTENTHLNISVDENNTVDEVNETNNNAEIDIFVNESPVALFSQSTSNGPVPLTVEFTSQSYDPDGTITSYAWDFGDGTTGTGQAVNHTYTNAGVYTVTLTVTDDMGLTDSYIGSLTVWSNTSYDVGLEIVDYTARVNPSDPVEVTYRVYNLGKNATFNVTGFANGMDVYSETLSLAGGEEREIQFNISALPNDFTLDVVADPSNALNESDEANNKDSVNISVNDYPIANFTATPTSGYAPLTVVFNASQSYDPDGTITSYAWGFGDGSNTIGQAVNHTYTNAGVYTVTLTVTDNEGLISTYQEKITANTKTSTGGNTGGGGNGGYWTNPNPPTPKPGSQYITVEGISEYTFTYNNSKVKLRRDYEYDPNTNETKVTLIIQGVGPTRTYRIVDEIPKPAAETLEDVSVSPEPDEVIREDPVIGWRVTLRDGDTFTVEYVFSGMIPKSVIESMAEPEIQVIKTSTPKPPTPTENTTNQTTTPAGLTNSTNATRPVTGFLFAAKEGSMVYIVLLVIAAIITVTVIALEKTGFKLEVTKDKIKDNSEAGAQ